MYSPKNKFSKQGLALRWSYVYYVGTYTCWQRNKQAVLNLSGFLKKLYQLIQLYFAVT